MRAFNEQWGNIEWKDSDKIHRLITEEIPAAVAQDTAYANARKNADRVTARIEHDQALQRVMLNFLTVQTELFREFSNNPGFKKSHYAWYHQGQHKSHERGLDFIGSQVSRVDGKPQFIGVQVKLHTDEANPAGNEWLKFLAGCFTRKIDQAIFITSGRLISEQRREAGEARVVVIEGRKEITCSPILIGSVSQ